MAKKKEPTPILGKIGDKLQKYIDQYSRMYNQNKIYDENAKTFDPTKVIPKEDLEQILQSNSGGGFQGQTMFEKFFDLSIGRGARYSEYEQIFYRIPEVAQALQIYVDSILAPNVGSRDNQIIYDTYEDTQTSKQAKKLLQVILDKTNFFNLLPQIIHTQLMYGDCYVELEPTSSGVRYIIHNPNNCSLVYDSKTDIELGLMIETNQSESKIVDMLSEAFPQLVIEPPNQLISIVSDKRYLSNKANKFQIASMEKQMTELLKDVLKDRGTKFKYLAPHRYVKFPIYLNNLYYPYGTSILDPVRGVAKQLLLIESALAVYRATRTPLRSLWTLEVAGIPANEIPGIMRGVMQRVRRQRIFDREGSDSNPTINTIPEFLGFEDDVWVTSIDGVKHLTYENLSTPDITPYTNDAEYFKQKLLSSLGIPPSYLAEESGGATRALLTLEDVRFSRTIKKYQSDINNSLNELANVCFMLINQSQFVDKVKISLPEPTTIESNLKIENLRNKLDAGSQFMDLYPNVPKMWVMKNIVGLSQDDIDEMEKMIGEQEKYTLFMDQKFNSDETANNDEFSNIGGFSDMGGGMNEFDMNMEESSSEGPMGEINLDELGEPDEIGTPNQEIEAEMETL